MTWRAARGDDGYVLVAAVVAAAFAFVALQVLAADQGAIASVTARDRQARLSAAADAGAMIAIHALASEDPALRGAIDGRARHLDFDGTDLAISVQDERGKAPLAYINDAQARALFQGAGAAGDRLDALVDEFRDWRTQDEVVSAAADASGDVSATGYAPRHGALRTVGELMALRDMDAALFARVAPAVTTFFEESGPFDKATASPLAQRAMTAVADASDLEPDSAVAGARPAEEIAPIEDLIGRSLTIDVVATNRSGARMRRTAIVELTGVKARPYWIRYAE